jgi:hypothetical protein
MTEDMDLYIFCFFVLYSKPCLYEFLYDVIAAYVIILVGYYMLFSYWE